MDQQNPKLVIIDGQGGKIGRQLVEAIKSEYPDLPLTAVGTNSIATATMLKAGADAAATGENPVITLCRSADIIIGPVGIVIADSLLGEVTPAMAAAVGQSQAIKLLIPVNRCENIVIGVSNFTLTELIRCTVMEIKQLLLRGVNQI